MLHITNGDAAARLLRMFVTGTVAITCDVLHDGPAGDARTIDSAAGAASDDDAWRAQRARWLAASFGIAEADARANLDASDRIIDGAHGHEETVLWFEHDLYDQLLLVRTLGRLSEAARSAPRPSSTLTLVCIDAFPGVDRFVGLGQLSAAQLATLLPARTPVTPAQLALGRRAWRAFRSATPQPLMDLWHEDLAVLPHLGPAIERLFEEYPWTTDGLSRTERALLRALAAGPRTASDAFVQTQTGEARPYLGDQSLFLIAGRLCTMDAPLLEIRGRDAPPPGRPVDGAALLTLTAAGRDVLETRVDAAGLRGGDRWLGGVRIGRDDAWRWDPAGRTLLSWTGARPRS